MAPVQVAPQPLSAPERLKAPGSFLVVGVGASAGGLDACRTFFGAVSSDGGMCFILIQHLHPDHESLMASLLSTYTPMTVVQATEGMLVEPDHVYVIPPGTYLGVTRGALHLSEPQARHGARLPIDFLFKSMAEDYGPRAAGVIFSGHGADGSLGVRAIRDKGGFVIAQEPAEAPYSSMPESAIMTGAVDFVLPLLHMPQALEARKRHLDSLSPTEAPQIGDVSRKNFDEIIDLLRRSTNYDFSLYKRGTLQRRIERRMGMASFDVSDLDRYLALLKSDPNEMSILATDLLINVTSFFRDQDVFATVSERLVPELIKAASPHRPVRIWIAGCSTGEEAYSIAMLFLDAISKVDQAVKLQIFASDVDPIAIATAREGSYPAGIEVDVSPAQLARFFSKEDHGYKVLPELRAAIVFTVQDVLADPPFSRLDMISCRNLLIYLTPEAQSHVISIFEFALRDGGTLLLGSAETIANIAGRFEEGWKPGRIFRRVGNSRPAHLNFGRSNAAHEMLPSRQPVQAARPVHRSNYAELCRRLVTDAFAPAAILINSKNECLYTLGPTDDYLHIPKGLPTYDLIALAPQSVRAKLGAAIRIVTEKTSSVVVNGGRTTVNGKALLFRIEVRPVLHESEALLLICFINEPRLKGAQLPAPREMQKFVLLEEELEDAREQLRSAVRSLENSAEEQRSFKEEALSVNEEHQSTNEELVGSKEELQALNEELTALNGQLQETLERQRTTSDDLQNVLYSTDVATLFLDLHLRIRYFTPATRSLFNVIPSDIGRPLADLNSLTADSTLAADAQLVLRDSLVIEKEIETPAGAWFTRRILPYRTHSNRIEGIVITFTDVTERKNTAKVLEAAVLDAKLANVAKSRFLAAASHDLRQPLQTIAFVQGLLAKIVQGDEAKRLVALLDQTSNAMSGMLNSLLDINEIDGGNIRVNQTSFPINDLLQRLKEEFSYHAQAQGLSLHVVECGLLVRSDSHLLEQIIRNLLSNALKYTKIGKVLLGCRRLGQMLSVEVWDTGNGIPAHQLQAIFEEYHQLDNETHERSRGLGLGLSIVQRLADLMGSRLTVRSQSGKGSVFAIEVAISATRALQEPAYPLNVMDRQTVGRPRQSVKILVVEDDPELRELLEVLLKGEGFIVGTARDSSAALVFVDNAAIRPDLILSDYNLSGGSNGLQLVAGLRAKLHREVPAIILTGDISAATVRDIELKDCTQLKKPVKLQELTRAIYKLLPPLGKAGAGATTNITDFGNHGRIFVVEGDHHACATLCSVLEGDGHATETFATGESFLAADRPDEQACILVNVDLPGMKGLELLRRLKDAGRQLPAIIITGSSDIPMAVEAMKAGAWDFVEKPIGRDELLTVVDRALEYSRDSAKLSIWRETAAKHLAGLTTRQHEIMNMVLAGQPSKNIAMDLGISQRTVENHRAAIMKKTGSRSLPALARLAVAASDGTGKAAS